MIWLLRNRKKGDEGPRIKFFSCLLILVSVIMQRYPLTIRQVKKDVKDVSAEFRFFEYLLRKKLFKAIKLYRQKTSIGLFAAQCMIFEVFQPGVFFNRRRVFKKFIRYIQRNGTNRDRALVETAKVLSWALRRKRVQWIKVPEDSDENVGDLLTTALMLEKLSTRIKLVFV